MGFGVSELTITLIFLAYWSFVLSFTSGMHLECRRIGNAEGAAALDELQLCFLGVGFRSGKQWGLVGWGGVKISLATNLKPTVAFKGF